MLDSQRQESFCGRGKRHNETLQKVYQAKEKKKKKSTTEIDRRLKNPQRSDGSRSCMVSK